MYANRGELRVAVESLGLSHLGAARLNDYINESVRELAGELLWAWRLIQTAPSEPPVTVWELGNVESVQVDREGGAYASLAEADKGELIGRGVDLEQTGEPQCWYHDRQEFYDDRGVISTWPLGGTVVVRQFSDRCWRNGVFIARDDDDEPMVPERQRDMIRMLAGEKGLGDDGRPDEAAGQRSAYEKRVERETEQNDRTGVHEGLRSVTVPDGFY